ncbi:MAG: UDP-N-acetylmuramate--L-alanine ligase [Candidatus Berkelbacteria bacterium]|nr:UDP-N-acetylmuramate--L-alanine ligase [Candidatus Berkelbacteria bacterium]
MRYHLVGINGISMSGLAKILDSSGHQVSGCDLESTEFKNSSIKTSQGHNKEHVSRDLDALIISAAVTPTSKAWIEVERAKQLGIPVISRSKMIGRLMQEKEGIAVAGMHGKTTVSAMIAHILEEAGKKPSFLIGGILPKLGNAHWTTGRYFVVEACEYARQFLDFYPKIGVVTNIEEEHLDTYPGGMPEIRRAFKKFTSLIPNSGLLILWEQDPNTPWLSKTAKCKVKTFSNRKLWPGLNLKIPGKHNLLNATAAARVAHEIGIDHQMIKKALNNFIGVKRRFEIKGEINKILVVDDYGHHPSEIEATLASAREFYPKKRIICVYQPHQYTRTKLLFNQFAKSFRNCDLLVMADIYTVPGRDEVVGKPGQEDNLIEDLVKKIKMKGQNNVVLIKNEDQIVDYLKKEIRENDLIITMGATKIYEIGEKLLANLQSEE